MRCSRRPGPHVVIVPRESRPERGIGNATTMPEASDKLGEMLAKVVEQLAHRCEVPSGIAGEKSAGLGRNV